MSLRGETFRRLATWLCSARTIDRLIDPAVGDFRIEVAEARRQGNSWHHRRVLLAGYLALIKVGARAVADTIAVFGQWTVEERSALVRANLIFVPAVILATLALEVSVFGLRVLPVGSVSNYVLLMTLLVPATLPISVPTAFAFGLVYAVPGRLWSRRMAVAALIVAILCGAALLANVAWVAPESNQRFRETLMQRPLARGENELSFEGLRQRRAEHQYLGRTADVRQADFVYHKRWAMTAASVVLVGFAMAIGVRSRRRRWQLGLIVLAAGEVYHELYGAGAIAVDSGVLQPAAAAWLANAVLLTATALVAAGRRLKPVR